MWDVWFDGQIVCSKIEHLSNIDEIIQTDSQKQNTPSEDSKIVLLQIDPVDLKLFFFQAY